MPVNYHQKAYLTAHSKLRRKLLRFAFNQYYHCDRCGSHENLQIHFLSYKYLDNIEKINYRILCRDCHQKIKHTP